MRKYKILIILLTLVFNFGFSFALSNKSETQYLKPNEKKLRLSTVDKELLKLLMSTFLGKGDLEEAYHISKKALELFPNDPYWLEWYSKISLWTNRLSEAFETQRKIAKINPSRQNIENLFKIALVCNKFDVASELLINYDYLKHNVNLKDLIYIFIQSGNLEELIHLLEDTYKKTENPNILQNLAEINYIYGDPKKAVEYLNELVDKYGITDINQVYLYYNILFSLKEYTKILELLKKYEYLATNKDIEFFEILSDIAWYLKDFNTAFYASMKLEELDKARLVDYLRFYAILYHRKEYQRASFLAKKGYEKFKDIYMLYAYIRSLYVLNQWQDIVKFLYPIEKNFYSEPSLVSMYVRSLYRIGQNKRAFDFIKATLRENFSEELLGEAILIAVETSNTDLAKNLSKEYRNYKHKLPKHFAILYFFLQDSKSSLDILRNYEKTDINELLLYADVLELYGRIEEAHSIKLNLFKSLKEDLSATFEDSQKLIAYLRLGMEYLPSILFLEALKVGSEKLDPIIFEDIVFSYYIKENEGDKLLYLLTLHNKTLRPWMELNLSLWMEDRYWQEKLLEKYAEILPIRDRVEAFRRTGQIKKAGYYAYEGLEKNPEDILLYKQFRDLVVNSLSRIDGKASYLTWGESNFLKGEIWLRYYLLKGNYLNIYSANWFNISNKEPNITKTKNIQYWNISIKKIYDTSSIEMGLSYLTGLNKLIGGIFNYDRYIYNKVNAKFSINVNNPSYDSQYMLYGGAKDEISLLFLYAVNSRISLTVNNTYRAYKTQDGKNIGNGFLNSAELLYKLRIGYPDYSFRIFLENQIFHEKKGSKGIINRILLYKDPDVLSESKVVAGVGFLFGFENKDGYTRSIRPFFSTDLTYTSLGKLEMAISSGIGGGLFRKDNLSLGITYSSDFQNSMKSSIDIFMKYTLLF